MRVSMATGQGLLEKGRRQDKKKRKRMDCQLWPDVFRDIQASRQTKRLVNYLEKNIVSVLLWPAASIEVELAPLVNFPLGANIKKIDLC